MEVKYKIKIPIGSALLMKYMEILLKLNALVSLYLRKQKTG